MAIKISGTTVIDNSQNITNAGIVTATSFTGDGSQLTNLPGGGGNTLEATASGTLADGSKVIVNADGTVSVVTQTETTGPGSGTPEIFESASIYDTAATFDSTNNRVVIAYRDSGNASYGTAVVGEVSGTDITFGTPVVFKTDSTTEISATFDSSAGKVVIVYRDSGNSGKGTARVGTVDTTDNSIDFGSESIFRHADSNKMSATFDSTNNRVVIAFRDQGASGAGTAVVGEVSGTGISFGSYNAFESNQTESISATFDSTNGKVVIAYNDAINHRGEAVVGTVNAGNNTISYGSIATFESSYDAGFVSAVYDSTNQRVVIAYRDQGNSNYGTAIVGEVSGTGISFGSEVLFKSGRADVISATFDSSNGKVVISYSDPGNSDYGTAVAGTVDASNNSISFGSDTVFESSTSYEIVSTFDSSNGKAVIAYQDSGNSGYGTAAVFSNTGFGALPQLGSPTVFESANTYEPRATYDSTNQRVVIVYRDIGNSGYGTAVVGTVSGTGISFGTPVVFNSGSTVYQVAEYDATNSKVVIAYVDYGNSDQGTAIVGTVNPTDNSIEFGSEFLFNSATTHDIGLAYDSANGKIIVAYDDASNYGYGKAKVGEVSGTNITFGSEVTFSGVGSNANDFIDAVYDSTNQRVVITFRDHSNSYKATAIVGEVSGTSISFGAKNAFGGLETIDGTYYGAPGLQVKTAYDSDNGKVVVSYNEIIKVGTVNAGNNTIAFGSGVVNTAPSSDAGRGNIIYDSDAQKIIITYRDYGNSNYGTIVTGSVSGTSITLDTPIVFESSEINDATALVYDSSNRKTVAAYRHSANSNYGTAVVFSPRTMSRNLTSENYIGISDGAYSDGQTATIQLTGAVDDAQSGLTPGQSYYVQNDGTLSETADNPSVFAGTALASTKLIVRG